MHKHRLLWQLIPSYLIVIVASLALVILYANDELRDLYYHRTEVDLLARARLLEEPFTKLMVSGTSASSAPVAPSASGGAAGSAEATESLDAAFATGPADATADSTQPKPTGGAPGPIRSRTNQITDLCVRYGQRSHTRITIMLPDGTVIADSENPNEPLENHADRPEIIAALEHDKGQSRRYSKTMDKDMMYVAIPIFQDDRIVGVLRTALSVSDINAQIHAIQWKILLGGFVIALLAGGISALVSRRISKPLELLERGAKRFAQGDFSKHLPTCTTSEIAALAETMNRMADELDARLLTMERQKGELEAILSSMAEGVLALDGEWRVIGMNRAAAELLEIDEYAAENRVLQELVRNPQLEELLWEVYENGRSVEGDITIYNPNPRHFRVHSTVLSGNGASQSEADETQGSGVLVVFHDITRLKRLENVRRDFVANVSHELKTPITSIKGFVETLLDGTSHAPNDVDRFLRIVAAQAERLHSIIEDLLVLSRLEQDPKQEDNLLATTRISDVVGSAIEVCSLGIAEKKIQVDVQCERDLKAEVNAPLLIQAVANLIDNAVKYSPPESAILIQATRDNGEVLIRVKDHGCGIGREHLPRLFERFYRVDKARSRAVGGTGLGLAIVKHIAQLHHGSATIESKLGEGSTFTLHLPTSTENP